MRPKPGVGSEVLEGIFDRVYDTYFEKLDNHEAKEYLRLRNEFAFKTYLKHTIKSVLYLIWNTPPTLWGNSEVKAGRVAILEGINKHLDTPIDLNNDFETELTRVLNVELGILTDEILIITDQMKLMEGNEQSIIFDFYDELEGLSDIHGRTLDEKMMLPVYVASVKSAIKKAERQKQKVK